MSYLNNISETNSEVHDDSLSLNLNLQIMIYLLNKSFWRKSYSWLVAPKHSAWSIYPPTPTSKEYINEERTVYPKQLIEMYCRQKKGKRSNGIFLFKNFWPPISPPRKVCKNRLVKGSLLCMLCIIQPIPVPIPLN